ncbi:hypothetical protein [Microbulbifer epialgicus]|uniref:Uncharacterized protein n=1 Tax=Microbulbifer epialgicus TaxID=393907 RepID=A0ABV4NU26_9GAMM
MKNIAFWTLISLLFMGCSSSEKSVLANNFHAPTLWALPDGKQVDIGGEVVSIIGTDKCSTGFGDTYPCWMFSLEPGSKQKITLSNGIQEVWISGDVGEGRIALLRPNGFPVIEKSYWWDYE